MHYRMILLAALATFGGLANQSTPAQNSPGADTEFRALLADEWKNRMINDPLYATQMGVRDYDDRLPQVTPADFQRRNHQYQDYAHRLAAINRTALSVPNRVSYDVFDFEIHHRLALSAYETWRIPLTSDEGFHIEVMRMAVGVVMNTPKDYENYIARLHAIPAYFAQQQANMREGIKAGFTLPSAIMPGIIKVLDGQQYQSPDQTPFFEPFTRMPSTMDAARRTQLTGAGRAAIQSDVIPAYQRLRKFFTEEYLPAARQSVGASDLPQGRAYYEALVKFYTNLEVTPEQVHELGVREVTRIRTEMDALSCDPHHASPGARCARTTSGLSSMPRPGRSWTSMNPSLI